MRLYKVLVFSFLCLLLAHCREDDQPVNIVDIDPVMYGFLFENGSVWKYRDPTSGTIDTIEMYKGNQVQFFSGGGGNAAVTLWKMEFRDLVNGEYFTNYISTRDWWKEVTEVLVLRTSESDTTRTSYRFRLLSKQDTMRIGNKVFHKITRARVNIDPNNIANYEVYCFADSIGIIKKEKVVQGVVTETRELVDFRLKYHPPWFD